MSFSFLIRYIKSTFFWIIGLYDIKVPLIKLKNFTTKFYPRSLFYEQLLAVFACNIHIAGEKKFSLKQWHQTKTKEWCQFVLVFIGIRRVTYVLYWQWTYITSFYTNLFIDRHCRFKAHTCFCNGIYCFHVSIQFPSTQKNSLVSF